jgi:uncharacterized membrane protein
VCIKILRAEVIPVNNKSLSQRIPAVFFGQACPRDLILATVWLAAAILAIYLPVLNDTPVRAVIALPVLLFIPGYCVTIALFPKEGDIELIERIVLSMSVSLAVVPLMGLGLNFTPWGIRLDPIVTAITVFTLIMILAGHYQRSRLPVDEQFRMPFFILVAMIQKEILPSGPRRIDRVLGVVLAFAMIVAVLTTIYIVSIPREGEQYTEFYLLGQNRTSLYPLYLAIDQNYPLFVSVGNHENRQISYTIEAWMMNTEFDNVTNSYNITTMEPRDRLSLTLVPDQTAIIPYNLSVNKTGYNRVEFLLFDENIPGFETTGSDRINASYRNLHLLVGVLERQYPENKVNITG